MVQCRLIINNSEIISYDRVDICRFNVSDLNNSCEINEINEINESAITVITAESTVLIDMNLIECLLRNILC